MTGEIFLVFVILAITVLLFLSDRLRLDLVALMSLLALSLTGILTPAESLAGFADPVVIMIAGLFVVTGAMFRTGLADRFGRLLGRIAGTSRARTTAVVMLGTGALSGLVSTTGTVALMLPVTSSLARNARLSPSLLLLPLAVAALLGGLLTLIATPPNIIVSNQLTAAGYAPFGFFDFTPVGMVMLGLGTVVLVIFGALLLPTRAPVDRPAGAEGVATLAGAELTRGYALTPGARLQVPATSPLVGVSPAAAELRRRYRVNIIAIRRPRGRAGRLERVSRTAEEPLRAGDELDVQGAGDAIARLLAEQGLHRAPATGDSDRVLAEVLLTPRSRLVGRTLADVRFRSRYQLNVLSVRRQGAAIEDDLAGVPLRFADTLLVAGSPKRIDMLRNEGGDFVVIARSADVRAPGGLSRHEVAALAILAGMLVLLTLELVPAAIAVLLAAVAMVLAGCLDMTAAYRDINWETVVLIAAILPMATAMQKTGGVDLVATQLTRLGGSGPVLMMAAIYVLTGLMSSFISNTATAALVAPLALAAALELGVSPYPLLMTVAVASSTAFATPVSTPANMLVLGPGDYRFADFARVGLPLQLLFGIVTLLVVPLLFPF
jgi:di/tricarboxylate transporter